MDSMQEKYDSALLAILQNEGKIEKFLDVVFGFLRRRTDFYYILQPNGKLGFKEGFAEAMTYGAYKKNQEIFSAQKKSTDSSEASEPKAPKAQSSKNEPASSECSTRTIAPTQISPAASSIATPSEKPVPSSEAAASGQAASAAYQAPPESYNGARRERYAWSQIIGELDVRVFVGRDVVKGNQVQVIFSRHHLVVRAKSPDGAWAALVDGELPFDINRENSIWTLVPREHVHIQLAKMQERWWDRIFVNEPAIDTRTIDCSRPMEELQPEAQATCERLLFDERQKQLGLPTSNQLQTTEVLRKAWDAPGSPFAGQPFDPSQVDILPSSNN